MSAYVSDGGGTYGATYLISLAINASKMLVLRLNFLAHCATKSAETLRSAVQRIQIGVDLILHIVVFRVGLKLVLGSVGKRRLLRGSTSAFQISVDGITTSGRLPGCFTGGVAGVAVVAVGLHDFGVALFAARLRCKGVGHVTVGFLLVEDENERRRAVLHSKHRLVKSLEFPSLLLCNAVL